MDKTIFDQIKHVNEYDSEYWKARELAKILWYTEYRNFENAIIKAITACKSSKQPVGDHFVDVNKMVSIGSEAKREILDYHLSRYACYLIAQNWDPRKEEIALAQTYFAIQTRKQEIGEQMLEDWKRVMLRDEMKKHNKNLAEAASNAWVENYATFQNFWYMGLYWWLGQKDIHKKKKLKKSHKILDHMWSEELAANLFRATQTEAKLKREWIQWELKANKTHHDVGKKIRWTIKELWGTMPENLPPADSVKKAEKRLKKNDKPLL